MDERAPIQVGIDLRPIPLVFGDDTYHFNPDPGGDFFATVSRIRAERTDDFGFVDSLHKVLATEITVPAERKQFLARKIGLAGLNAIASAYAAAVLADPT